MKLPNVTVSLGSPFERLYVLRCLKSFVHNNIVVMHHLKGMVFRCLSYYIHIQMFIPK